MACLPGSPAAHGRRLFELLQEQQEPFLLDVFLLERGYSDRLLASRYTSSICWPGNAREKLHRLTSHHFKAWREGLLRNILNWVDKAPSNARSNAFWLSDFGSKVDAQQFACSRCRIERAVNAKLRRSYMETDSKQRSSVSVLELRSCEGFPVHHVRHKFLSSLLFCSPISHPVVGHFLASDIEEKTSPLSFDLPTKVLDIFNELLELAYTPEFYQLIGAKRQLDRPDKLLLDCERESEEKILDLDHECLSHETTVKAIHEVIPPCERQKDLTSISQLMVSDLSSSRKEWSGFQPQVREIGIEIEATLFEDIKEEAILEMLSSHCTFKKSSSSL